MSDQIANRPVSETCGKSRFGGPILGFLILVLVVAGIYRGNFWHPVPVMRMDAELQAEEPNSETGKSDKSSKKNAASKDDDKAADDPKGVENPFPKRFKLDGGELSGGVEWLNCGGEISLADVRGKVVLIDFWTYCCINCMHILPDLKFLEQKYPKELVVIGVHSAKFDNEKDSENIRRAVLRYEIEHPVVNDADMKIWKNLGVRAWPTLVLVDPEGYYCGYLSGEGNREPLDEIVGRVIAYHKAKGTLDETPVRFDLERERVKPGALRFPGKVLADEASNRLFISDSNHNRIVITTLDGKLLDVIGRGTAGSEDGTYTKATFFRPQGCALVGDQLYVSDTENHLLRVVDLKTKRVSRLAGTGQQSHSRDPGGPLLKTALNSPWAISVVDGKLHIAMAGPHQIWSHELGSDDIHVFAGTGREDIQDGSLAMSAFAQPSGISSNGEALFVADSEGSAVRKIDLSKGDVTTIAGTHDLPHGQSLFAFGDVDGTSKESRLQHPLDVLAAGDSVFVADTYNHKIKKVSEGAVTTFIGNGKSGNGLTPVQLSEPSGMSIAKGNLYVADTNNHRVLVVNLKSGAANELKINGLQPPAPAPELATAIDDPKGPNELPVQNVVAGEPLAFEVGFKLPKGFKLNKQAPVSYQLNAIGEQGLIDADQLKTRMQAEVADDVATITIPLTKGAGDGKFTLAVSYSYCRDGVGGVCKLKTSRWTIPLKSVAGGKPTSIKLEAVAE